MKLQQAGATGSHGSYKYIVAVFALFSGGGENISVNSGKFLFPRDLGLRGRSEYAKPADSCMECDSVRRRETTMMAVVGQVARASKHEGYPTILVVGNRALLSRVVDTLQLAGYLVLIACNGEEALRVAKIHSRPIQILLADETVNARRLAAIMEPYRPEMRFLRVTGDATPALATVRQLLPAPKQRTTTG